jgi:hypothetical protein
MTGTPVSPPRSTPFSRRPVPQTTDKHGPKHHLGDGLAERMDDAVRRILADDTYRRRYAAIPLESTPPLRDLETMVYNDA